MTTNENMPTPLNIGELTFYEPINHAKLQYIMTNSADFQDRIKEDEKKMRRYNDKYNAFAVFQKIINNCYKPPQLEGTEKALIKVSYKKGKNSNDKGRWYCTNGIGLQPLCGCVRHTVCDGIWLDYDQANSHPNILHQMMKTYGFQSHLLDECINDRESFLKKIQLDKNETRDDAKTKVIATINGAQYTKDPVLKELANQIKPFIQHVINLPEYSDELEHIKKTYPDDKNISGKTISRILQFVENDLLECYINYLNDRGLLEWVEYDGVKGLQVSLIFDGFMLLLNPSITDEVIEECRLHALNTVGYDIPIKVKPFDNQLKLPENYAECCDDLPNLINKFMIGLNLFVEKNEPLFKKAIMHMSNKTIADVGCHLFKDHNIYDAGNEMWYYCNTNNIWKESKEPLILKGLLNNVLVKAFEIYADTFMKEFYNNSSLTDDQKDVLKDNAARARKIASNLEGGSYIKSILSFKELYMKDNFLEDKIDSKPYLFAFSNKVFDFRTNTLRYIKSDDFIMTNTRYEYPEYADENDTRFIEDYFKTLFPDEQKRNYILDHCCVLLNGEKKEQYFNIHTGKGSNSKSTLNNLIDTVLGNYAVRVSPENFTKPRKGANDTGELYKARGKRRISTNEPNDDDDNKLQVSILKPIAESTTGTLIARSLYKNAIEFKITFALDITCNNKPEPSSHDGGIMRRVRVIDYDVKFVDEPDPKNPYEAKKDPYFMFKVGSDGVRNAFIRMLLDRWVNRVSKVSQIFVPQSIKEASKDYINDSNEVYGWIHDNYVITKEYNNSEHRIQSSVLFADFKLDNYTTKLDSKTFKKKILAIEGINEKKISVMYFIGIRPMTHEEKEEKQKALQEPNGPSSN